MIYYRTALLLLLIFSLHLQWAAAHTEKQAKNQKELVKLLYRKGHIKSEEVEKVMSKVDRQHFVGEFPYRDFGMHINYGTYICAPKLDALVLEHLKDHLKKAKRVLDVGCGSGYLTACMAMMQGEGGYTIGLDHIQEVLDYAKNNLKKDESLVKLPIKFVLGDGRLGDPAEEPFDVINVGAAVSKVPGALLDQLNKGGRMILPVGYMEQKQNMTIIDKDSYGNLNSTIIGRVFFDPINDPNTQWPFAKYQTYEEIV